jgi:hypothetical protein
VPNFEDKEAEKLYRSYLLDKWIKRLWISL